MFKRLLLGHHVHLRPQDGHQPGGTDGYGKEALVEQKKMLDYFSRLFLNMSQKQSQTFVKRNICVLEAFRTCIKALPISIVCMQEEKHAMF